MFFWSLIKRMLMFRIIGLLLCLLLFHDARSQRRLAYHEFEAEHISKIHLYGSFCDVKISHDQKIRFLGEIEGSGRPDDFTISSGLSNTGTLVIHVRHRGRKSNYISKARIQLHIPKGIVLNIDNTAGDIKGDNLISGTYNFKSSSGDVSLSEVIGDLRVETTSGDISIENLQGEAHLRSTSGDKNIGNAQGTVRVSGTSGSTYLHNIIGPVHVSSTSGNVTLKEIKGRVEVTSTSGNIYTHQLLITGDSKFALISGNLKIDLSNPHDDFKFQLMTGSGIISVNGIAFKNNYLEGEGPIIIDAATGSGNLDLHF